ncbi:hypothetical protein R5R35_013769 [Gryllus longicercus]|uniref:Uncharacterized protein n=1 Tax=Gryllus longicercus TaxID=2509291 RepID=A0AAN9Z8R1_9ORTH
MSLCPFRKLSDPSGPPGAPAAQRQGSLQLSAPLEEDEDTRQTLNLKQLDEALSLLTDPPVSGPTGTLARWHAHWHAALARRETVA